MVGLRCSGKKRGDRGADLGSHPVGLNDAQNNSFETKPVSKNQFIGEEGIGPNGERTHYIIPRHRVGSDKNTSHLSKKEFLNSRLDKRHGK